MIPRLRGQQPLLRSVTEKEWRDTAPEWEREQAAKQAGTVRQAIGTDLAYTDGGGDNAAAVVVAEVGNLYHVRHVDSFRRDILVGRERLRLVQASFDYAVLCSYIGGQEKGILALLAEDTLQVVAGKDVTRPGIHIIGIPTQNRSKKIRATRTIQLWNGGRIVLNPNRPWSLPFARSIQAFTGSESPSIGEVDALVSAIDWLELTKAMQNAPLGSFKRTRV